MNCFKSMVIVALIMATLSQRADAELGNSANGERIYRACAALSLARRTAT